MRGLNPPWPNTDMLQMVVLGYKESQRMQHDCFHELLMGLGDPLG